MMRSEEWGSEEILSSACAEGSSMQCAACHRIEQIRARTNPSLIAELRSSYLVLHDHQPYEGWCVLLLKEHAEHMHLLAAATWAGLAEDMREAAGAIVEAFGARRINYECLGNQLAHVHWHVIPRYDAPKDPDPKSAIWVRPKAELECGVSPERRGELIFRLQKARKGWDA